MNLTKRYGYLIQALNDYPFTDLINKRMLELKYPASSNDVNSGIKAQNKIQDPKVLIDLIKIESDSVLSRYKLHKEAIEYAKSLLTINEWELIRSVYIQCSMTVDGASYKYFDKSRNFGYDKVIKPFFENVENYIYEYKAKERFVINID